MQSLNVNFFGEQFNINIPKTLSALRESIAVNFQFDLKDVYELLDLGFGKCHLMMAVPKDKKRDKLEDYSHTRVATKFPRTAEKFFNSRGMQMEYIKLNGSIELGPIIGLSESIVDIVETGTTLRENNLEEIVSIMDATARLIVNRVSYKLKFDRINKLVTDLKSCMAQEWGMGDEESDFEI